METGRETYLTPALVMVAFTLGAYFVWKQSVTSRFWHGNNNEIVVIPQNRRTETAAENKAAATSTRQSVEDHTQLKISAHCKTSVGEINDSEKPSVSELESRHGFSEVSKEITNEDRNSEPERDCGQSETSNEGFTSHLKQPIKEVIVGIQEVMAENFGLINKVSSSESNEALNDHKVTSPDPSHNIGSENEVPDLDSNRRTVIASKSLQNFGSISEVYFKVNDRINYSTIALRDSSSSSGSEVEVSDCESKLEQTTSEEDISRRKITLPVSSINFAPVNKSSDQVSNKTINNTAVVSDNSGTVNQVSASKNNETMDNKNVKLQDPTQPSGSSNEVNNTESNDNAINNSVSHSDGIQHQGVVKLTRHKEEDSNKMYYYRRRWRRKPMYIALKEGNLTLVQSLLRQGASMEFDDRQGQTPTHLAAASGNIALLEMLVGWGGDLSRRDLFGYTPFHRAALRGQTETINWLYERGGGYIMERSWAGWTALHLAAINGHYNTALQLLQLGADVNAKDKDGWTPLYLAKLYKRAAVMQLLQSWGGTF